ncbi:hypothetical protein ABTY53_32470 [Streptomyces noursei]
MKLKNRLSALAATTALLAGAERGTVVTVVAGSKFYICMPPRR